MNRRVALFLCAAAGSASLEAGRARAQSHGGIRTEEDSRLYHWLLDRMVEAESIKVGMSRADLLRVFMSDGGLQKMPAAAYILRSCDLIKVDVEFRFPEGTSPRNLPPDAELTISKISKPYLELMTTD
ncbi:MAG TPA: hypothetical protein VMT20_28660 [Terriglobia bacterium]|nr:hypothetical protein [Terriglobia bacterium]